MRSIFMRTGLLIIVSEILSVRTQDKNLETLAAALREKGMVIAKTIVIKDDLVTIAENMQALMQEFEWTFCSGGLGPTRDDITKHAASVTKIQKVILLHYQRYGRIWTRNECIHHQGVIPLENPRSGTWIIFNQGHQLLSPTVPREFKCHQVFYPWCHPSFTKTSLFPLMEFRRKFFNCVPNLEKNGGKFPHRRRGHHHQT